MWSEFCKVNKSLLKNVSKARIGVIKKSQKWFSSLQLFDLDKVLHELPNCTKFNELSVLRICSNRSMFGWICIE